MNKIWKIGVIGLKRGLDVVSTVKDDENIRITAICDEKEELLLKAEKALTVNGVSPAKYTDFDEMLASDIDGVFIANYAPDHAAFSIRALDAGKHVLSEIPAVWTLEEAKELRAAVARHPELTYMISENACCWAFVKAWKLMNEEGKFGDIVYAEGEYLHAVDRAGMKPEKCPDSHWRTHLNAIRYSTHELGPLLYIMNDRCVSVTCMESGIKYNPYKKGAQMGAALFKTEKGAVIRILVNFGSYIGYDHNYRLQGTCGSIQTDPIKPCEEAHSFASFSDIPGTREVKIDIPVTVQFAGETDAQGHGGADGKIMRAFIGCLENGEKPEFDVDFGLKISLPGIYAHLAAESGKTVEIPRI